jgi:protein disulfide isomerase family A protein 3
LNELHTTSIILFYAPWCGHCQQFKPIYEKVAKTIPNMYMINDDANPYLAQECKENGKPFEVTGYPTIVKVNSDLTIKDTFLGDRTPEKVTKWINS